MYPLPPACSVDCFSISLRREAGMKMCVYSCDASCVIVVWMHVYCSVYVVCACRATALFAAAVAFTSDRFETLHLLS